MRMLDCRSCAERGNSACDQPYRLTRVVSQYHDEVRPLCRDVVNAQMLKRKAAETREEVDSPSSKRIRKSAQLFQKNGEENSKDHGTPSKSQLQNGTNAVKTPNGVEHTSDDDDDDKEETGSPTPRANGISVSTPMKSGRASITTPSRRSQADRSARRKSAALLEETGQVAEDAEWTGAVNLARTIVNNAVESQSVVSEIDVDLTITPSRRGRGRPKGAKNRRSPTPEGDIPPEERYFFQTRAGPQQFSSNSFTALELLTHEEYIDEKSKFHDPYTLEMRYLLKLHSRAFIQWRFELEQGYNMCLYGWGSKRRLVHNFADWLCERVSARIVVLNGYATKVNIRSVLATIASVLTDDDEEIKIPGQIQEVLDQLLTVVSGQREDVFLLVHSIDGPSLRRPSIQALLARLAAHPQVHLIATADTATFQLLWNSSVRDHFNFVFHDTTTFAPYELETTVMDDVNELLGRKGQRVGGKDGVGFVLKSLPGNARSLYRILLTELLTLLMDDYDEDDDGEQEGRKAMPEVAAIEYRTLYQKATEEFVCSSDMNFRFLLKEFHDHQMLTTTRDAGGTEMISVPLSRDEIEAVLEDLVV